MRNRLLTAAGLAIVGIPILIFSQYIAYPIAIAIFSMLACWEVMRLVNFHKNPFVYIPTFILSGCLPIFTHSYFFGAPDSFFGLRTIDYVPYIMLSVFGYLVYLIAVAVLSRGKMGYTETAKLFTMVSYITVAFTSLTAVRYIENGVYYFLLPIIGAWICDIFAFFTGMLIGKHKLAPELSPKKTVEGAIGGIVFTFIAFMLYGLIVDLFFELQPNYIILGVLGLIIPVVAQVGDLWASLIKREHSIKDYSRILPGHGGVIDRFDSIFATSTVMFIISLVFPIFY